MSTTVFAPAAADDFEGFEFAALVADWGPARRSRPSRRVEEQTAIRESLGIYRHRTHERRD